MGVRESSMRATEEEMRLQDFSIEEETKKPEILNVKELLDANWDWIKKDMLRDVSSEQTRNLTNKMEMLSLLSDEKNLYDEFNLDRQSLFDAYLTNYFEVASRDPQWNVFATNALPIKILFPEQVKEICCDRVPVSRSPFASKPKLKF